MKLTNNEYKQLWEYLCIVKNKKLSPGTRRIARFHFDYLYKQIVKRNTKVKR